MKKLISLVLAIMMVAVVGLAFATEAGHGSITINNAVTGHTYTAYQIFAGDWDAATAKLSNIVWGSGISAAGQSALQTAYSVTDAEDVAKAIPNSDAGAIAFADHIGDSSNLGTGTTGTLSGTIYTISDLADGYYMIVDTYSPSTGEEGVVYARYMIQKVGNAIVNNKVDKPTVDKDIDVDNDLTTTDTADQNTANIGDTVTYIITSRVPDMTGYKEYYMDFADTLSKGLTYDVNSLSVKIGETTLTADEAYTLTVGDYNDTTGTSIAVHLKDLVSRHYAADAAIVITYTAKVNDSAVIGNAGNPNTVKLTYSNNPGHSGDGNPDNPDSDIVTGETPDSVVKTYVTEIELIKVDGANNTTKLAGAVFNVKGTQINKVIITGEKFVKDAAGTYYLLKDGTYTTKTPTDATISQYESTSDKYKKEAYATTSEQETKDVDFQVVTGSDGIIKLTGLKEGTYTFTEIQAPDGYNLLKDPITVTITSNVTTTDATFAWTGSDNVTNKSDGTFTFNVANNSGTELPSTGGIGTTIFYIVGGLLLVGAAIVLVARRKASEN